MSKEYLFTINTIELVGANQDYVAIGVFSNRNVPGFAEEIRLSMPDSVADELNAILSRWVRTEGAVHKLLPDGSECMVRV